MNSPKLASFLAVLDTPQLAAGRVHFLGAATLLPDTLHSSLASIHTRIQSVMMFLRRSPLSLVGLRIILDTGLGADEVCPYYPEEPASDADTSGIEHPHTLHSVFSFRKGRTKNRLPTRCC